MTVDVSKIYLLDVATGASVEAELRDAIEQAQLDDWQTKWRPALLTVLQELARRGVPIADVVLHVGAGTFKPVEAEDPGEHQMHEERFTIPDSTSREIAAARARQARVWAVGTTTVRALESAATPNREVEARDDETRIFLRPPYEFRVVDALLTNFHLPRSTLLMLVAAFAGYDLVMRAYREAVDREYRFFSYGDAMVVV